MSVLTFSTKMTWVITLLMVLIAHDVTGHCFHGNGPRKCLFKCHCGFDRECDLESGSCPRNICDTLRHYDYNDWSGVGCQKGGIYLWKQTVAQYKGYDDGAKCVDDKSYTHCHIKPGEGQHVTVDLGSDHVVEFVNVYREDSSSIDVNVALIDREGREVEKYRIHGDEWVYPEKQVIRKMKVTAVNNSRQVVIEEARVIGYQYVECVEQDGGQFYYGPGCLLSCGEGCAEQCDYITGQGCTTCHPGYQGQGCIERCRDGYWGPGCSERCNCAGFENACDKVTGACSYCAYGYQGANCSLPCNPGTWGISCLGSCNCADKSEICDHVTGFGCSQCAPGYRNRACSTPCRDGYWGPGCNHTCNCADSTDVCDKVTGEGCTECQPGYQGANCTEPCEPGLWGPNCSIICNCADGSDMCDAITGYGCSDCVPGYQGLNCTEPCTPGTWGPRCNFTCNCADDAEVCNEVTGQCPQSGCAQWWTGTGCDYKLPRMPLVQEPEATSNGTNVTLTFTQLPSDDPEVNVTNISYRVTYREIDEHGMTYLDKVIGHLDGKERNVVSFTLPALRTPYYVCVVPVDATFGENHGQPSLETFVYTNS